MNDDNSQILEPLIDEPAEWEKGLTPVERFEKLVQYGEVNSLLKNSFFQSLDKPGQINALAESLDHLIHQLDLMAQTLFKVSTTHSEGVKVNQLAISLSKAKVKLLQDFVKGVDIVAQLNDEAKGERYF
jgi:hypothetical protein